MKATQTVQRIKKCKTMTCMLVCHCQNSEEDFCVSERERVMKYPKVNFAKLCICVK